MKRLAIPFIILTIAICGSAQAAPIEIDSPEPGYYNTGAPLLKDWPADLGVTVSQGSGAHLGFYHTGAPLPKDWPLDMGVTATQNVSQKFGFFNTGALPPTNWPGEMALVLSPGAGTYSPTAPLTPTFILVGSGLIGLIGFKQFRMRQTETP